MACSKYWSFDFVGALAKFAPRSIREDDSNPSTAMSWFDRVIVAEWFKV